MAKTGIVRVATCQFAVCADPRRNGARIRRQLDEAAARQATVVHFPECAASGYGGVDVPSWNGYDWAALREQIESVCAVAAQRRLWVVLGSSHPLTPPNLPHNSLYVIDPGGRIVERYDKRFCTSGDLARYSPGDHLAVWEINGVRCGAAICYDVRFPELYRAYRRQGVALMFHSFYNARTTGPGIHTVIMRASMQCRAATNSMWISGNNASGHYQSWQSVLIQPDGRIAAALERNRAGVMVNEIDTAQTYYDASGPFRERSMDGVLHSGELVDDPRSRDRAHP